jgi:eukaryotic-like serine/threonine-protein kinase
VQGVTALLAGLLDTLRRLLATDVCPGGWPWAVTALGVGVGLLPTIGAVVVALLRKRIGSRYGFVESFVLATTGIVSAGLLPLLVFTATGRVFSTAAAGSAVPGLSRAGARELASDACFVIGTQAQYLGRGTVAQAFTGGSGFRFVLALFLLVLAPLVTAAFVLVQARLALRRGPRWPSTFFWLPIAAVVVLGAGVTT